MTDVACLLQNESEAEGCGVRNRHAMEPWVPRFKGLLAGLAGLVLMLSGCESSGPGYTEIISRLEMADSPRLYWWDNDHVFVPGYAPDDKLLTEEGKPKKGLYILDTRNNSYVRHADLGHYSRFCYYQGFVTYTVSGKMDDPVETDRQMEGVFGQEKMLPIGVRFNADLNNKDSYTECPRVDRTKRLRPEHAALEQDHFPVGAKFLRPEDGYIFLSYCKAKYCDGHGGLDKDEFDDPVKLYRPNQTEPIELPILVKELGLGSYIRYVEWANKYLIIPATRKDTSWPASDRLKGKSPYQVYLMTPNGDVETITIPDGKWLPPMDIAWTRAGLYFNGNVGTEQGEGCWWLKPNGELKRIFDLSGPMGLSPDGCKLAVAAKSYRDKPRTSFVRIVDFCSKN